MFGINKDKEKKEHSKTFNMAEKMIQGAEKFGVMDVMKQAFIKGAPQTYAVMINKLQKKIGRTPTLEECKESLHKNPDFFKAAGMMGFEEIQLEDMLEGQYRKMFGELSSKQQASSK